MEHYIFIKSNKKYIKIYFNDIAYIKGLGNYVEIVMTSEHRHIYYKAMKELIDVLPDEFMRVHNSYIVNLATLDAVEDNHIIWKQERISVGKSYRECLREALDKRLL